MSNPVLKTLMTVWPDNYITGAATDTETDG